MASATFSARAPAPCMGMSRSNASFGIRAMPTVMRATRGRRSMTVVNAIKYDINTKVFDKELTNFAGTEEYIYR